MEWTDDAGTMARFNTMIREARPNVDAYMKGMSEGGHLGQSPPWMLFILLAKFIVVYDSVMDDLEDIEMAEYARHHMAFTETMTVIMEDPILHAIVQAGVQGMN